MCRWCVCVCGRWCVCVGGVCVCVCSDEQKYQSKMSTKPSEFEK